MGSPRFPPFFETRRMIRVFYPVPDSHPDKLSLDGERFHYLTRVLRLQAGDSLQVFDGKGRTFAARIRSVGPSALELQLALEHFSPQTRPIVLLQGLPKGEKLDWILQKGTELGMTSFAAVMLHKIVAQPCPAQTGGRGGKGQKIAEEGAPHKRRAEGPLLLPPPPPAD